mmetsp:Transcript_25948/g.85425  ORF Transcript_25948/g.85425 Transcript_25948/m.85425 type:complete len:225 (-) Transcript_25948:1196-1870(-)
MISNSFQFDQIRVLKSLAHRPLRYPPIAAHRHERLSSLAAFIDPPHLPHRIRVLSSRERALQHRSIILLAHIVHSDSAIVESDGEKVDGLVGEGDGSHAAAGSDNLMRILGIFERPEEDHPIPLVCEVELPVANSKDVRVQLVPGHTAHVPLPAQLTLEAPKELELLPLLLPFLLGLGDLRGQQVPILELPLVVQILHNNPLQRHERVFEALRRHYPLFLSRHI